MKRIDRLDDYVVKQYESYLEPFKEMIKGYLDLIKTYELLLDNEDYKLRFNDKNEMSIGSKVKPKSSQVESLTIEKLDDLPKIEEYILKCPNAFEELTESEKEIFILIFIKKKSYAEIQDKNGYNPNTINSVLKSSIIRFSLKLGFHKLVKYYKKI